MPLRLHVQDDARSFDYARRAETSYGAQLRKLAGNIGDFVTSQPVGATASQSGLLAEMLRRYAQLIQPWAKSVASRMIEEVSRRDWTVWKSQSALMAQAMRAELNTPLYHPTIQLLLSDQVKLITSLPVEAAQRVHNLALEGMTNSMRASEIAEEIMKTGDVTKARATTIARTEVGRTSTMMTMVRAQSVDSEEFIWRTARDADVRPSHRRLEGKVFRWDSPPLCDAPDHHALPGAIWNCRCYPEPIVPDLGG